MMLEGKKTIRETYYDILSVNEDASYEEIRASYRAAVLAFHPDKVKVADDASSPHEGPDDRFLEAQKAWEILGSSSSRAIYDSKLRAARCESDVAEDIHLDDMMVEDNGDVVELFYKCRCGDYFFVDSLELGRMRYTLCRDDASKVFVQTPDASPASVILPCGTCSLHVRLWINVDNKE